MAQFFIEPEYADAFMVYPAEDVEALESICSKTGARNLREVQEVLEKKAVALTAAEREVADALKYKKLPVTVAETRATGPTTLSEDEAEAEVARAKGAAAARRAAAADKRKAQQRAARAQHEAAAQQEQQEQQEQHEARASLKKKMLMKKKKKAQMEEARKKEQGEEEDAQNWASLWKRTRAKPKIVRSRELEDAYLVELDGGLEVLLDEDEVVLRGTLLPDASQRRELLKALDHHLRSFYPPHYREDPNLGRELLRELGEKRGFGVVNERLGVPNDANLARATLDQDEKTGLNVLRIPKHRSTQRPYRSHLGEDPFFGGYGASSSRNNPGAIATGPGGAGYWW